MREDCMKIENFKNYLFILSKLLILILSTSSKSIENKIIFKINNEIITSFDLENEVNYLLALNPNLNNLSKQEIIRISKKSVIQEKIKSTEILKNFENPKLPLELLEKLIKNIYFKIGIANLDEFKIYLNSKNVSYENVIKKLEIEALWNELIFSKFSNKLNIDEEKIMNDLKMNNNQKNRSYLMSEIFFEVKKGEKLNKKFDEISRSINKIGFDNTALKYSISETASVGGKLEWIKENSLKKKIMDFIKSKKLNEYTDPIAVPGGFLILQINEIKFTEVKKDLELEFKNSLRTMKNNQLNQFSKMYLNKIKKDIEINEI